jgi:hypothetical protein
MSQNKSRRAQFTKYISYKVQHFDVSGYVGNPVMIKNLYKEKEEAKEEVRELRDQLEASRLSFHQLQLEKQALELRLKDATWKSFLQLLVTIIGTVILAIGINIVTSPAHDWIGYVMVVLGGILEVVAYLITFLPIHSFKEKGKGSS